jgi:hypothetical protein
MIPAIQESQIFLFLLSIAILIFVLVNRMRLKQFPASETFILAFCIIFSGWILAILEKVIWEEFLGFLEHLCYAVSSILLCIWCWKVFGKTR